MYTNSKRSSRKGQQRRKKLYKSVLLVGSLLWVIGISGCALTKDYVTLSYASQQEVKMVEGAEAVDVRVNVSDTRTVKDKVSRKKNGYGMEMASIIAKNDVVDIVGKAIETELANRGFNLAEGSVLVAVELSKFYNDFKIGFLSGDAVAEVIMNVQVRDAAGTLIFSKSIIGEGRKTGIQLTSGKNAQEALDVALQAAVSKLVNDTSFIDALLKAQSPSTAAELEG